VCSSRARAFSVRYSLKQLSCNERNVHNCEAGRGSMPALGSGRRHGH
jgi:hypothetical protein